MINKGFKKNVLSVLIPLLFSFLIYSILPFVGLLASSDALFAALIISFFCLVLNFIYAHYTSKPEFTGLMLVGLTVKLLLTLVAVFVYSVLNPTLFANFALQLVIYYVLFSIFEIRYLLFLISTQNKT